MTNKLTHLFNKLCAVLSVLFVVGVGNAWGGTKRIYFDYSAVSSDWPAADALMRVHCWGGDIADANYDMTAVDGESNLIYADIDDRYTSLLFFRQDPNSETWWNQTQNWGIIGDYNRFKIKKDKGTVGDDTGKYLWADSDPATRWAPGSTIDGLIDIHNPHMQPFSFSGNTGTYAVELSAHTTYQFKILEGTTAYGLNNNVYTGTISNYESSTSGYAYRVATAGAGTYTFTWDKSTKKLSITYPSVTHPSVDYCYLHDYEWEGGAYIGLWNSACSIAETEGAGTPIANTTTINEQAYYYFALGDYANFKLGNFNSSNLSDNLTTYGNYGKYQENVNSSWGWYNFSFTVTLDNQSPTTAGATSATVEFNGTAPAKIESLPSKIAYKFDGYYTLADGGVQVIEDDGDWISNVTGYTDADGKWIHEGGTATLYAHWTPRHTVTFVSNGVTVATIYRSTGEAMNANPADNGNMPSDPADNTLSCESRFVGWSAIDIDGHAITTAPTDLFTNASSGDASVSADATFYAVFAKPNGDASSTITSTFTSKAWTDATKEADCLWKSGQDGTQLTSNRGIQVTTASTGANAKTKNVYNDVTQVVVTYSTNASSGAGTIGITVGGVAMTASADVTSSGGTSDRTITYTPEAPATSLDGKIKILVNCTTNSLYIKSVSITASGYHTDFRTRCPALTATAYPVTASTPFFITSSASKTVRSQDSIHIEGSHLTKEGAVSISSPASKFVLKSRTNGSITTNADGTIDTYAYIYYTPDAEDTEDGLDINANFTISVAGNGGIDVDVDQELIGRHLPANFVIAVYKDSKWWALPADHTTGTPAPIEIAVDNETTPTKVLTADANVYTLYGQHNTSVNNGNGQYVKLAMHGQNNAPMLGSTTNSLGKSTATNIENDQDKQYWWKFEQKNTSVTNASDAKYYMFCPNNNSSFHVRLYASKDGDKWGQYSSGTDEIRLIPWYAEELGVTVSGWTDDALMVTTASAPSASSITKVTATIDENTSSATALADNTATDHALSFSGVHFSENNGELLTLKWLDGSDALKAASFVTVPSIILAGANDDWNDFASAPTLADIVVLSKPMTVNTDHAKAKQIVIDKSDDNTGKLTIQANKGLEVEGTVKVYNGENFVATGEADLVLESDEDGNASLIFDNSNACKATVQMYSIGDIEDEDTWNWQFMGTPFTSANALYSYYGSYLYEWQSTGTWDAVANGGTMTPFTGYCITQDDPTYYVMDGTLNSTTSKTLSVPAGVEMVFANSWSAPIDIGTFTDEAFGIDTKTVYMFNTGFAPNKVDATEGTAAGTYVVVPIHSSPYTGNELIAPMQGFYVDNTSGSAGSITMDYATVVRPTRDRNIIAGPMHAPKRAENEPAVMKIKATGSRYSERVVILERADFSTGFDNGWDGKNLNEPGVAPILYALRADGTKDAVSAIPAYEGTVVGFRKGEDNAYTFSFEYDGEETLYLNDIKAQKSTLINAEHTYAFSTESGDAEARFIISATPIGAVVTGIESSAVSGKSSEVRKVLIEDQIYIIRGGKMYSAEGQMVK